MKRTEERERIREELAGLSPRLAHWQPKGDGLRIPPGRLDGLANEVMARIAQEDQAAVQRKAQMRVWRRNWAVAAGISVLLAAGWWQWSQQGTTLAPAQLQLAELSDEEINSYVYNNIQDFDLNLLIESGIVSEEDAPLLPEAISVPEADTNLQEYLNRAQDELDDESFDALF